MPGYDLTLEDGRSIHLDSDSELQEPQIVDAIQRQFSGAATSPSPEAGAPISTPAPEAQAPQSVAQAPGPIPGQSPPPDENAGYFARTGRRLGEAGQAFVGIPGAAGQLITGGGGGRLQAVLNLLKGAGSIISPITAPVEAAGEETAKGFGAPEETARTIGDITGLGTMLGTGLLAKAGKLTDLGMSLAKILGVGHFSDTLSPEEAKIADFAATRDPHPIDIISQKLDGGPLPMSKIAKDQELTDLWKQSATQAGIPISDIPEPGSFQPKNPLLEFSPNDQGGWQSWIKPPLQKAGDVVGTPVTQSLWGDDPRVSQAMMEMAQTNMEIDKAVTQTQAANREVLSKMAPDARLGIYQVMADKPLDEVLPKLSDEGKSAAIYTNNLMEDYKAKIIEIERGRLTPSIYDRLLKQAGGSEVTQGPSGAIIDRNLWGQAEAQAAERVKDTWGLQNYLPRAFFGDFFIRDAKGNVLGVARTRGSAEDMIESLAKEQGLSASDMKVESKVFMDPRLLPNYQGRVANAIGDIARSAQITNEDLSKIVEGNFQQTRTQFFGHLLARGNSQGFSTDLNRVLDSYASQFERYARLAPMRDRVEPIIAQLRAEGKAIEPAMLQSSLDGLMGYKGQAARMADEWLQALPGIGKSIAPNAVYRFANFLKTAAVNTYLRYNLGFQMRHATKFLMTLAPIADLGEINAAIRMYFTEAGQELLKANGVDAMTLVGRNIGPADSFNNGVHYLTSYNKAVNLGMTPTQADMFGRLRGSLYGNFTNLQVDKPLLFRAFDPTGALTLFQRFHIKHMEQLIELMKNSDYNGVGKWIAFHALMGGTRALTMGQGGYLSYRTYQAIKDQFGQTTADAIHYGLPSLVHMDMSGAAQLYHPAVGANLSERLGNAVLGVYGGLAGNSLSAYNANNAPDPSALHRSYQALVNTNPLAKQVDALGRMITGDNDIRTSSGRLKYKADFIDLLMRATGARNLTDGQMDEMANAAVDLEQQRNQVIESAAAHLGWGKLSGVTASPEMVAEVNKQINNFNAMFPLHPINPAEINAKAKQFSDASMLTLQQRLSKKRFPEFGQ